jgi:hypothetical protein
MSEREVEMRKLMEVEPYRLFMAIGLLMLVQKQHERAEGDPNLRVDLDTEVVEQFLQSCSLSQLQELRKIADWLIEESTKRSIGQIH